MEEFSERFDGQVINSLMDCLAGYKQVALGTESRDIIAIETEQRLMCFTVLQQGGTNNVAMSLQKKGYSVGGAGDYTRMAMDLMGAPAA